jgi:two-component system phosphate regulon response regulator PhoB
MSQRTVLLADDEAVLRLLVKTTLRDHFRVVEAVDGASALAAARRERPDALILDWMMPGMTGVEVAIALRAEPGFATTPIIFLTAKSQDEDRRTAEAVSPLAYLVKPFSPLELLACVEKAFA